MREQLLKPLVGAVAGFHYGVFLLFFSFIAAGAGHGTSVVIAVAESPFPVSGPSSVVDTLFGDIGDWALAFTLVIPLFWTVVGALLGASDRSIPRALFLIFMVGHYVGIPLILGPGEGFDGWEYVNRALGAVVIAAAIYVAGQFILWFVFLREQRSVTGASGRA